MKQFITVATTALVLVGAALFVDHPAVEKLQVWSGVIASDVESQIDDLIGQERVMRQQAFDAIQTAKADIERLEALAVSSGVDAELMAERIAILKGQEQTAKDQLGKLAAVIDRGEPVTQNSGTVWQVSELERYAETKIVAYETIRQRVAAYEQSRSVHLETAEQAQSALLAAKQNVANMEAALELLEAKMGLLASLQAQPDLVSVNDPDVAGTLTETENLMDSLLDEVEREIRIARERSELRQPTGLASDDFSPLPVESDELIDRLYTLSGTK